jgi:hypothetical protein
VAVAGLTVLGVALAAIWHPSRLSHWPHVPPPELYVTTPPKQEDVAGIYQLTRQTITANGLAVLEGRRCGLELRPDGSFTVTNYPDWSPDSSTEPYIVAFHSVTGGWRCDTVNITYHGHACWGVVLSNGVAVIDALALRSRGAPYDLMLTYGDGDEGGVMTFGRKK